MDKTQRIRDPVHDLIVFDERSEVDSLAWRLLETTEFQRLRRIKQLGVSEFVFPGATHSRFSHSVGVFHIARELENLIRREFTLGRVNGQVDETKIKKAVIAALVHDIGHGPFSHAFEEARKSIAKQRGETVIKKHEDWTAEIIENPDGNILPLLGERLAKEIADLLRADIPSDMYHSIVSSSFDADRLDYLQRDRFMTGAGSGAFDYRWLLDNVRVAEIDVSPPTADNADAIYQHSFCLGYKARDAAEDFLLARYRLYTNVYFHKTTRGFEQLLAAIFRKLGDAALSGAHDQVGLPVDNPIMTFFGPGGETVSNYLKLDDTVVWGAIEQLEHSPNEDMVLLASRLRSRDNAPCIDVQNWFVDDTEKQRRARHKIEEMCKDKFGSSVFKDEAALTLYGEIGADDTKAHKRLMVQLSDGRTREITDLRDATIAGSEKKRFFHRYYFLREEECERCKNELEEIRRQ